MAVDGWVSGAPTRVDGDRVALYGAATEAHGIGPAVPACFGFVLLHDLLTRVALSELAGGSLVLHRSHEICATLAIRPGVELVPRARLVDRSSTRLGLRLLIRGELIEPSGALVAGHVLEVLVPGACDESPSDPRVARPRNQSPPNRPADDVIRLEIPLDAPARYATASGDRQPIHLDDAAARAVGLPGVVAHGMYVLARTEAVLQARHRDARLTGLAAVFSQPVRPGESVDLEMWTDSHGSGPQVRFRLTPLGQRAAALKSGFAKFTT
jgi:acyl dehydratase